MDDSDLKATETNQAPPPQRKTSSFTKDVNPDLTSIPILLCCFTSGLIDASVFNGWSVFASMQTGNTIILSLGASSQPRDHPHLWLEAMVAILFFFLGCFVTGRVSRALGATRKTTLSLSFAAQTGLVAAAAALVQARVVPGLRPRGSEDLMQLVPLAMLAFQAGQQCVAARALGFNEIPTTVLTSVYCDLGNDPLLFVPLADNWKRNRRFLAVVLLLLGGIVAGWLNRTPIGMAAGLWMAAAIKACITIAWVCWAPRTAAKLPA